MTTRAEANARRLFKKTRHEGYVEGYPKGLIQGEEKVVRLFVASWFDADVAATLMERYQTAHSPNRPEMVVEWARECKTGDELLTQARWWWGTRPRPRGIRRILARRRAARRIHSKAAAAVEIDAPWREPSWRVPELKGSVSSKRRGNDMKAAGKDDTGAGRWFIGLARSVGYTDGYAEGYAKACKGDQEEALRLFVSRWFDVDTAALLIEHFGASDDPSRLAEVIGWAHGCKTGDDLLTLAWQEWGPKSKSK